MNARARRKRMEKADARNQRVLAYQNDPANTLADICWKWAPRNGNHLPLAECGLHHAGPCCGCDSCCRGYA